jgi:malate dehydrogenase (oxaloacetate-decarboxylating)
MEITPSPSYSITIRIELEHKPGMFARVAEAIGRAGGSLGSIDIVARSREKTVRDVTVEARDFLHEKQIVNSLNAIPGIHVVDVSDVTFLSHLGGKIEVVNKLQLNKRENLAIAYTPGVARICTAIHHDPEKAYSLTIKKNTVAVVSDGTAVLGLGDIGPEAAMPVMEGKAMLFKEFGGVNAFPICLSTKDPDEIIKTVKYISPGFGGINLEDISSPRCFEIETRLQAELDIPVFHDDQHGTAVVVLAALYNALKIVGKKMENLKVVVSGVGAAGVACTKIIMLAGVRNIIGADRAGAIYKGRTENMNQVKEWFADHTNADRVTGSLSECMKGADVFIGVSSPGLLTAADLKKMAKDSIVFAMANPVPEIMPEEALPYVRIMATGRSDYPNQINNVLCFPGIFKGALRCYARQINEDMKLAAARAIASCIPEDELNEDEIIPSVYNRQVADKVADEVERVAVAAGLARKHPSDHSLFEVSNIQS